MAIRGYTAKLKLIKPEFDADTWHDYEYSNLETIDAVLGTITGLSAFMGEWKNSTQYHKGEVVTNSSIMYIVNEDHITDAQQSFEDYWLEHPTFYQDWNGVTKSREWAVKTDGVIDDPLGDDYSSKAYAISAGLVPDGSAKEWAINDEDTAIGETGEYSAKHYALKAEQIHDSIVEDENVIAVGTDLRNVDSNIKIVGLSIDNVNKTGNSIDAVESVADDLDLGEDSNIKIVAEDLSGPASTQFIKKVAEDIDSVRINAQYKTQIDTNANNISAINIVAGISSNVTTIAENAESVTTVAGDINNINDVADDLTNIDAVAAQLPNITQMADKDLDNLTTSGETHIGIKGYDATRTFKTNDVVSLVDSNGDTKLYKSLVDNNIGNPVTDITKWAEVLLGSKIDNLTIEQNDDKEIEVHGVLDAVDNTKITKTAHVTQEWYDEHFALNDLDDDTDYITDSEVSTNVKSFRNVGDIFYTSRLDTYLNGAVECDGGEYYIADYIGEQNIGRLFQQSKLPYCTYAEYQTEITAHGVCGKFAYDGGTTFKVPTLQDVYIEASNTKVAEFGAESLPNITGSILSTSSLSWNTNPTVKGAITKRVQATNCANASGFAGTFASGYYFNANDSNTTYQDNAKVKTDRIKYRAMIQLATQTTDEAIATMTQMRVELDSLKALPHIINSQETATGGYNVYSNGYYEEWGRTGAFSSVTTISLSKTMKNGNYNISINSYGWDNTPSHYINIGDAITSTSFNLRSTTTASMAAMWKVSGFLAEGQW